MSKVINYAPYVFGCKAEVDKTLILNLFVMVPIAKTRFIGLFNRPDLGIKNGFNAEKGNRLNIHLNSNKRVTAFGDKLVVGDKFYWGGCFSFKYSDTVDLSNYVFTINIHRNNQQTPFKKIGLVYDDIEAISFNEFNQFKDGGFAIDCPYIYLDQIKGNSSDMQFLIPRIKFYEPPVKAVGGMSLPINFADSGTFTVEQENAQIDKMGNYEALGKTGTPSSVLASSKSQPKTPPRRKPRMKLRPSMP